MTKKVSKKQVKEDPVSKINIRLTLLEHKVEQIDSIIKLALSRLGLQKEYK